MSAVLPGRYTVATGRDSVVVFLIGMRINQPWRVTAWGPVFAAMPRMLTRLAKDPEFGMLGFHNWFGRTTVLTSYWRSAEDVQRFASDPDAPHAAAWRAFNRRVGTSGSVGIWHELYTVRRGDFECVYNNMPRFGLGKALEHVPVGPGSRSSRQRMAGVRAG